MEKLDLEDALEDSPQVNYVFMCIDKLCFRSDGLAYITMEKLLSVVSSLTNEDFLG